ncbi:hypothetical protein C1H46_028732 [Malus baccata]|uniref:Uncharacterized protein n=1 Tax=Malus baccata TaxID=106549 RepID=A0A540LGW8_MALBA|nr:hypothetical protein C1H46_028732 [Malus baccata]
MAGKLVGRHDIPRQNLGKPSQGVSMLEVVEARRGSSGKGGGQWPLPLGYARALAWFKIVHGKVLR